MSVIYVVSRSNRPLRNTSCIKLYLMKLSFSAIIQTSLTRRGRMYKSAIRQTLNNLDLTAYGCFTFFQTLKNFYLNYHKNESADPGVFVLLACGTASSTCGQLASYPLSLVRTKLQAQGMD